MADGPYAAQKTGLLAIRHFLNELRQQFTRFFPGHRLPAQQFPAEKIVQLRVEFLLQEHGFNILALFARTRMAWRYKEHAAAFQKAHLQLALLAAVAKKAKIKIWVFLHFIEDGLKNAPALFHRIRPQKGKRNV